MTDKTSYDNVRRTAKRAGPIATTNRVVVLVALYFRQTVFFPYCKNIHHDA